MEGGHGRTYGGVMKTASIALGFCLVLISCQKPNWVTVDLPASPDGAFRSKLETLSEGGGLYVSRQGEKWAEYRWLSYGQCAGAELYWAANNDLILAYDRIELSYFVDAPDAWGGAKVLLCNKRNSDCPTAKSRVTQIPSCNDFQV